MRPTQRRLSPAADEDHPVAGANMDEAADAGEEQDGSSIIKR